jgi:hypothetical protein
LAQNLKPQNSMQKGCLDSEVPLGLLEWESEP